MNDFRALPRFFIGLTGAIVLVLMLSGCGSKGALYLPAPGTQTDKKNEQEKKP